MTRPVRDPSIRERGLTLVELMVAMVISTIVVFFLFSIQQSLSEAFRGQTNITDINQNLRSARQYLLGELRMAGYGLGTTGTVGVVPGIDATESSRGLIVQNNLNGDGNDGFTIVYADADAEVVVTEIKPVFARVDEPPPAFANDEPVIMASRSAACLVAVTNTNPNQVHFNPSNGTYNQAPQNRHCDNVRAALSAGEPVTIRRAIRRSYRIDPDRAEVGFLQMSPSGGLVPNDWEDLGVGFTNMQLATQYYEEGDLTDADFDGDPELDWYSSDNQAEPDPTGVRPLNAVLVQVSLSIEASSTLGLRGAAPSLATPAFVDPAHVNNNRLGDWGQACPDNPVADPCGVDLANLADGSRPDRYKGDQVYRSSTSLLDLRNMGVGK